MATLTGSNTRGTSKRKLSAPRIDMTPMVDLAFLLLTFFVMTTTLMKNYTLELVQPRNDASGNVQAVDDARVLNVVLAGDNKVYWYMGFPGSQAQQTDFSSSGLRKVLLEKQASVRDLYVFIKAVDHSKYQNMIDVLDEMMITQVPHYALVDPAEEDKQLAMR